VQLSADRPRRHGRRCAGGTITICPPRIHQQQGRRVGRCSPARPWRASGGCLEQYPGIRCVVRCASILRRAANLEGCRRAILHSMQAAGRIHPAGMNPTALLTDAATSINLIASEGLGSDQPPQAGPPCGVSSYPSGILRRIWTVTPISGSPSCTC
jgi:hypothetical protein